MGGRGRGDGVSLDDGAEGSQKRDRDAGTRGLGRD